MDLNLCDGMSVGSYQSDGMDLFCSIAMDDGEVVPVHNYGEVGRQNALYQTTRVPWGGDAKKMQASSFVEHMISSLLGPNVTGINASDVLSTAKVALTALYSRLSGPRFLSRLEAIYAPAPTAAASVVRMQRAHTTTTTTSTSVPMPVRTPLRDALPRDTHVDGGDRRDTNGVVERPLMVVTPELQLRHPSHKTHASIATKRKRDVRSTTATTGAITGATSRAVDSSKERKTALQALLLQLDAELGVSRACAALENAVETDLRDGPGMLGVQLGSSYDKRGLGGICDFDGYYDDPGPTLVTVAVEEPEPVPIPIPVVDVRAGIESPLEPKGKGKAVKPAKGHKASSLHDVVYTALIVSVFEGLRACLNGAIPCLNEKKGATGIPVVTIVPAAGAGAAAAASSPSSSPSSSCRPSPPQPPMWLLDAVGLPFSSFDHLRDSLSAILCPIDLGLSPYDPEWDSLSHFTVIAHVACALLGPYRNKTLVNRLASRIVDPPGMKACPGGEAKPITRRRQAAFVAVGTAFLGEGEGNKLLAVKKRPKSVHTHSGLIGDGDGTGTVTGGEGGGVGIVTVRGGRTKKQSWGHVLRPPEPLTLPFAGPKDDDGGGDDGGGGTATAPVVVRQQRRIPPVVAVVEVVEVTSRRWGEGATLSTV